MSSNEEPAQPKINKSHFFTGPLPASLFKMTAPHRHFGGCFGGCFGDWLLPITLTLLYFSPQFSYYFTIYYICYLSHPTRT